MKKPTKQDIDKIYVFDNIKDSSKDEIIETSIVKEMNKKEVLFFEKQQVDKIYFLLEGKVSILKINENGERKIIFILTKGEMINELSADNLKTSIVECEIFEKSLVLECDISTIIRIMENDFMLTKNILSYMEKRTRRLYRQLKNSVSIKIDKKLAAKLYRMGKEFGILKGEWTLINIDLTITYLAEMLGCKRETLSRAMKTLQYENLVQVDGKKLYIKKEELANYFKKNC